MDDQDGSAQEPMSNTTATLSPQLAVLLRGALQSELVRACEDAPQARPESVTRALWTPVLRRLAAAFRGLDRIGWEEPEEQPPVTITLDATMIEALETDADYWRWAAEAAPESADGRARAARFASVLEHFLTSVSEHPSLMIPAAAIPLVRECAREGIPTVSDAIDGSSVGPRECARRLNALSDLLDLIGWGSGEEPDGDIDASDHAHTLTEVAPSLLDTLTSNVRECDDDDPEEAKLEEELRWLSDIHKQAQALSSRFGSDPPTTRKK